MNVLFPLKKVRAFDRRPEQARKLADYAESLGLEAEVVSDPRGAVTGCDIIVTSGPILKTPHETIKAGWMDEGAFASLVDFDSFWERDAMKIADHWTTDHLGQYSYYKEKGYFRNCPAVTAELGDLVTGKKQGRRTAEERTFAANLGLALDDMAVAPLIHRQAIEKGIGIELPL